jgi:hypothetical protein
MTLGVVCDIRKAHATSCFACVLGVLSGMFELMVSV